MVCSVNDLCSHAIPGPSDVAQVVLAIHLEHLGAFGWQTHRITGDSACVVDDDFVDPIGFRPR